MEKDTAYYTKIISKIVILAFGVLGIFLTYKLAIFYIPFIIAILISSLVEPIIKFITKHTKIKRKLASIISLLLVVLIIGVLLFGLITKIVQESTNLLSNVNNYFDGAYTWTIGLVNDIKQGNIEIPQEGIELIQNSLNGIIETLKTIVLNFVTGLVGIITSIPTMITYIFITILATVFMCFDKEYIPNTIKSQIPTKWFNKIKQIINEMCSVSVKYIKAEAKLSFMCFILVLVGLSLINICGIKVNYPIMMAVFIGFIDLLPLFGAGAVMIPWTIISFATGNVPLAIATIVLWIIWVILKQLTEPKMVSKEMGIHPLFTLIGMYTGFKIAGVLGLILGPITLLILKNIFSELISKGVFKSFFEME